MHAGFLKYCRSLTGNRHDALDLAGESVLIAFGNLEKLRNQDSFKSYLYGIARRLRLHYYRRIRFQGVFDDQLAEMLVDPGALPDSEHDSKVIFGLLDRLPPKQREAFVLFEISGFSLKEIRELQGGTLSGVSKRLQRGREQLRHWLEPSGEQPQARRQGAPRKEEGK